MINFLTEELKGEVKKEYVFRILIVFFISLFVVMIISICLLMPASFLSKTKVEVVNQELLETKSSSLSSNSAFVSQINKTNEMVKALSLNIDDKDKISTLLEKTLAVKNSNIKISSLSSSLGHDQSESLTVYGVSNTRDGLIMFVKDIKSLGIFSSVDFPVSNLIKDSNIDFKIGLTVNK